MTCTKTPFHCLLYLSGVVVLGWPTATQAQVIPDDTLGAEGSQMTPDVVVQGAVADLIEGGATRGGNLFHSFLEFNIDEGQRVYFANPEGIESILSRITGSNPSNIFGMLGVDGSADLFLLNPNGIVFGETASLNVSGSFVATTANEIRFGEQGIFSTITPELPSQVLSINPSAFFFNQMPVQPITQVGPLNVPNPTYIEGLRVPDGRSLVLLGGEINIQDGRLRAPGGRLELGAVSGQGVVGLAINGNLLSLDFPDSLQRADIAITGLSDIDVTAGGGGDIVIQARNLNILNGSDICAGIGPSPSCGNQQASGLEVVTSQAGDIIFNAQNTIRIADAISEVQNRVNPGGVGDGGNIVIESGVLLVENGGQIIASTQGQGNAGNISIETADEVTISGEDNGNNTIIVNSVNSESQGLGGSISINSPLISVTDNARLVTVTFGLGRAGNLDIKTNVLIVESSQVGSTSFGNGAVGDITIQSKDSILLRNEIAVEEGRSFGLPGGIFSQVDLNFEEFSQEEEPAQGGNIILETNLLEISNGSRVSAATFGVGNAGDLIIRAEEINIFEDPEADTFFFTGVFSGVNQSVDTTQIPRGNGGDVIIDTNRLTVSNGGRIDVSTEGVGDSGAILIDAEDILLASRGQITTQTTGQGNAGNIAITANNIRQNNLGLIFSGVSSGGTGRGGDIDVQANSITLNSGAQIGATVIRSSLDGQGNTIIPAGQGNAGSIRIVVMDEITLDGTSTQGFSSGIFALTETGASGEAGDIQITTDLLRLTDGAVVGVSTANEGNAGEVIVNASELIALNGGQIVSATRDNGRAGTIRLNIAGNITLSGSDPNFADRLERARQFVENAQSADGGDIVDASSVDQVITTEGAFSGIYSSTTESSTGNSGRIELSVIDDLTIEDGARVSVQSRGIGGAGDLSVQAGGNILLSNQGLFSTESQGEQALAGDIQIQAGNTFEAISSNIITSAANASGGNINITAGDIRLFGNSDIRTNSAQNGGTVTMTANSILAFADSDILASAGLRGGDITLNTPGFFGENYQAELSQVSDISQLNGNNRVDINATGSIASGSILLPDTSFVENSLNELSSEIVDTATLTAGSCIARADDSTGSFVVTGSDGLPLQPGGDTLSNYPTGTVQTFSESARISVIQEPQGLYQLADGRLVLSHECSSFSHKHSFSHSGLCIHDSLQVLSGLVVLP